MILCPLIFLILTLNYSICPTSFTHSIVYILTPILKIPLLDPNIITNYLPISQLPFLR